MAESNVFSFGIEEGFVGGGRDDERVDDGRVDDVGVVDGRVDDERLMEGVLDFDRFEEIFGGGAFHSIWGPLDDDEARGEFAPCATPGFKEGVTRVGGVTEDVVGGFELLLSRSTGDGGDQGVSSVAAREVARV